VGTTAVVIVVSGVVVIIAVASTLTIHMFVIVEVWHSGTRQYFAHRFLQLRK
jgi:hypothetical protein